ncbi:MAG TPA: FeoA family protein [Bacteriovoracaceae bacterium]|nr:FeoA family protein [Bacteriovoracaceae bacterium]
MMTLDLAPLNKKLLVRELTTSLESIGHLESRLMHLGFITNEPILLIQKAPYFQVPILVEVKGRRIALSLEEARLIEVEEAL